MMHRLICSIALGAAGAPVPLATVHVQVRGCDGKEEAAHIRLRPRDQDRYLEPSGSSSVIANVPYGSYIVSAWDSGGGTAERYFTVNTAEVWLRIGIPFPSGDRLWPGGDLVVTGTVRAAPTTSDWWVRVEGMFLDERRESPVSSSGRFAVGGLDMGTYLLEVFDGPKLRHIETIEIDLKRPTTQLVIPIPTDLK